MPNRLFNTSIISVSQFDRALLEEIFTLAREMKTLVQTRGVGDALRGKLIINLFYEPSTRTSTSFAAAAQRLGAQVTLINNVQFSSVSKGETLPDTIRTLASYADAIVLRHPEAGSAAIAAHYSPKPVINAGDGVREHPTQALLDLFTIHQSLGRLDGIKVAMVGDLKYGRTVHSLAQLLSFYGATLHYVSPPSLRMPAELQEQLAAQGVVQHEHTALESILSDMDVLYVTRVQQERFRDPAEYAAVKDSYIITPETLQVASPHLTLLHPFPRVNEISMAVDADPRAAYFRQMENGMYIRMAVLKLVLVEE